jgi:hypothetical protein
MTVSPFRPLCYGGEVREVLPGVKSVPDLLTVDRRRQEVMSEPKVLGDRTIRSQESLSMPWGLETLHAPLPLPGRLVRVLGAVIEVPVLPVLHPWHELALGRPITLQLIRDHHARGLPQAFEQLPEESLRSGFIPLTLHQNVEDVPILIDAIDRQEYLLQMPLVTWLRTSAPELIDVCLPKFHIPLADRLIRHDNPACKEQFFDIPIAEAEPVIEPDAVADNLGLEAVVLVAVGRWCVPLMSMAHRAGTEQAAR